MFSIRLRVLTLGDTLTSKLSRHLGMLLSHLQIQTAKQLVKNKAKPYEKMQKKR